MTDRRLDVREQIPARADALRRLSRADADLRAARRALDHALQEAYPLGADIVWKWGRHLCAGVVTSHGDGDRIEVRNTHTGKTRWIATWNIMEAFDNPV